jgi:hypothetical protein
MYTIKSNNDDDKKLGLVYMSSFPGIYGEDETTAIARSNAAVHNQV